MWREGAVHLQRFSQSSRRPRVLLFVGEDSPGSSLLRGWELVGPLWRLGWRATAVSPYLSLTQRQRLMRAERPDVILLQQQRHRLNRPKHYLGYPCVFDIDDADFLEPFWGEGIRECSQESTAVIAGSRYIADWCRQYNSHVEVVWTGTPVRKRRLPIVPNAQRGAVIAWACSDPGLYPHESALVGEVLTELAGQRAFEFWLFGLQPGQAEPAWMNTLRSLKVPVRNWHFMAYDRLLAALEGVAIGLCPLCVGPNPFARGKSFGKTLAYMAAQTAIVASNEAEHPLFFTHGVNGLLVQTRAEWVAGIGDLLQDPARRHKLAQQAQRDGREKLSSEAAARGVDRVLRWARAAGPAVGVRQAAAADSR